MKAQASPIVVMIITSVVVILGLALISYVTSLISTQQARASLQAHVFEIQSNLVVYPEYVSPDLTRIYIGVLTLQAQPLRLYILAVPVDGNISAATVTNVTVRDPVQEQADTVAASCNDILIFSQTFIPLTDYYRLPPDTTCNLYAFTYQPQGRPYAVEIDVEWAPNIEPRLLTVYLFIRVGDAYYEAARLTARPTQV